VPLIAFNYRFPKSYLVGEWVGVADMGYEGHEEGQEEDEEEQ
jgi:hypothetical protein